MKYIGLNLCRIKVLWNGAQISVMYASLIIHSTFSNTFYIFPLRSFLYLYLFIFIDLDSYTNTTVRFISLLLVLWFLQVASVILFVWKREADEDSIFLSQLSQRLFQRSYVNSPNDCHRLLYSSLGQCERHFLEWTESVNSCF